jgi:hypothetical protein
MNPLIFNSWATLTVAPVTLNGADFFADSPLDPTAGKRSAGASGMGYGAATSCRCYLIGIMRKNEGMTEDRCAVTVVAILVPLLRSLLRNRTG